MPQPNEYTVGQLVRCTATFTDIGGTVTADPNTVTVTVRNAAGSLILPTPTRVATGAYQAFVDITDHRGTWAYRFVGTGTLQAAEEFSFEVRRSQVLDP